MLRTKIKTKTDKDMLKQSFQRPKDDSISIASTRNRQVSGIGPISMT